RNGRTNPQRSFPFDPFAVRGLLAFPSRMRRRISMTGVLEGKVALVTGAGGGIGLATAKAFAEAGASVVVADRDEELIGKAAEGLRSAGHTTIGVTCDVTDKAQVTALIEQAVDTYGRLDAAFNNAGIS